MAKTSFDRVRRGGETVYDAKALERKVNAYFRSITRRVAVTEDVPTGEVDRYGHALTRKERVYNELGEEMEREEYILPPCESDLADFLNVHRATWTEYCNHAKHPEFTDTTERALCRMQSYYEREILKKKSPQGAQFLLENGFGMSEVTTEVRTPSASELSLSDRHALLCALLGTDGRE